MPRSSTYSPSTSSSKPTPRQLRYIRSLAEKSGTTFTPPQTFNEAKRLIDEMKGREPTRRADIQRERREISHDMATRRGDAAQVSPDELSGYGSSATWTADAGEEAGPRVVHCEREPFDIYCGRGSRKLGLPRSKWANPFRIGPDGTREEVIAKHKGWIPTQPHLMAALDELRGRTLGCHCAPRACHCHTLVDLGNAPRERQREWLLAAEHAQGHRASKAVTPSHNDGPSAPPSSKGEPHALLGYTAGQDRRLIFVQRIHGAIRVGDLPADGKGERYLVADSLETCGELDALLLDYTSQAAKLGVVPASPAGVRHTLEMAA
jgi:hypothetical protein